MRPLFTVAVLVGAVALASAQPAGDPDARYGLPARLKQYPQGSPKEALKTALGLVDAGQYTYLAAHLLDPAFVDEMVADRAKGFEAGAERELAQLREFQRANPDKVDAKDRVPLDPKEFRAAAAARARAAAFKQFARDIEEKFRDDPQALRDMRRILREGMFAEADPVASAGLDAVKGKTLYFKKVGERWFLENRQTEEPKKDEPKKGDGKKEP